jgi:hypothetical protein
VSAIEDMILLISLQMAVELEAASRLDGTKSLIRRYPSLLSWMLSVEGRQNRS